MIKAVILDVDGILKGSQEGINFPTPHTAVIEALKRIRQKDIPVILCTGNYYRSILGIITTAHLDNFHISDNGALISNPLDNNVLEKHCIPEQTTKNILEKLLSFPNDIEVFSDANYFVEQHKNSAFTKMHAKIVQDDPIIVTSFMKGLELQNIIKIEIFTNNSHQQKVIDAVLAPFANVIHTYWAEHPAIGATKAAVITTKGISKVSAFKSVCKTLGLMPQDMLGVGDSVSDWRFMSECGYVATLENANDELKQLVAAKGEGKYYIAPHVDENGILEVFRLFSL